MARSPAAPGLSPGSGLSPDARRRPGLGHGFRLGPRLRNVTGHSHAQNAPGVGPRNAGLGQASRRPQRLPGARMLLNPGTGRPTHAEYGVGDALPTPLLAGRPRPSRQRFGTRFGAARVPSLAREAATRPGLAARLGRGAGPASSRQNRVAGSSPAGYVAPSLFFQTGGWAGIGGPGRHVVNGRGKPRNANLRPNLRTGQPRDRPVSAA